MPTISSLPGLSQITDPTKTTQPVIIPEPAKPSLPSFNINPIGQGLGLGSLLGNAANTNDDDERKGSYSERFIKKGQI
jgi:hypothetical protein